MKPLLRSIISAAATAAILGVGAAAAQAGSTLEAYNTTIGKFGGAGYSNTQTQRWADYDASVQSGTVGGNYTADVCVVSSGSSLCLGGTKTINDGSNVSLWHITGAGGKVRLKFTDGWQLVNVQVNGNWASN